MKILTVHSFAVHGTASLKAALSILGARVLPVPSLILTGLTNMPGFRSVSSDFETLLRGSFELARQREEALLLYIGYLGNEGQVALLLEAIASYRELIRGIVVDPVSGDHGRAYVPEPVIRAWPRLLAEADWALPNFTELQLLSGLAPEEAEDEERCLQAFRARFPGLSFVVTSLRDSGQIRLLMQRGERRQAFAHDRLPQNFSGTGDVFASYFIAFHYLRGLPPSEAMQMAALRTLALMRHSMEQGSSELLIEPLIA